jgi:hypothetical protein
MEQNCVSIAAEASTSQEISVADRKVTFSDARGDKKLNQIGAQLPMIEVSEEVMMLIYSKRQVEVACENRKVGTKANTVQLRNRPSTGRV